MVKNVCFNDENSILSVYLGATGVCDFMISRVKRDLFMNRQIKKPTILI